jgi:nucleotide-binding universal stress UspA family protein
MVSAKAPLATIVHPTDFSAPSASAFAHALNIALTTKSQLCLLHVRTEDEPPPGKSEFRHVREVLVNWSRLPATATAPEIETTLGLRLSSVSVPAKNARTGILDFLDDHPCDLVVLATHEHKGLGHWFDVSVEQTILRKARVVSLFLRDGGRHFVDPKTGALALRTVLVPIDDSLACLSALRRIRVMVRLFAPGARVQLLHVGERTPNLLDEEGRSLNLPIIIRKGPVAETILEVAGNVHAELIAMPTAGRHGLLDAVRGSTTARILDDARWPLLAIPVGQNGSPG